MRTNVKTHVNRDEIVAMTQRLNTLKQEIFDLQNQIWDTFVQVMDTVKERSAYNVCKDKTMNGVVVGARKPVMNPPRLKNGRFFNKNTVQFDYPTSNGQVMKFRTVEVDNEDSYYIEGLELEQYGEKKFKRFAKNKINQNEISRYPNLVKV